MSWTFVAKIASNVLTAVVCVLLLAFIAWFTVPRVMGWKPMVVLTGSMEPTLPLGSVAFVEPRDPSTIRVGDVMTFRHPEPNKPAVIVTHRVTAIEQLDGGSERAFRTQGDANNTEDSWTVPSQNVIGTVKFTVPYVGHVTDKVQSPLGFLLIIGLPALYLAAGEVRSIAAELAGWRKRRRGREAAL